MIKIYGKLGCPSCTEAKLICDTKGFEYEYLYLGKDYSVSEFQAIKEGHRSFPLIMKDGKYIGTTSDFKKLIESVDI